MTWTRESLAWLAGLIEGEGSFSITADCRYIRIKVKMTDEDVVRQAQLVAAMGTVGGPYDSGPRRKDQWQWVVTDSNEAYALMIALYPWLGQRRQARIREITPQWLSYRATNPRFGTPKGRPWSEQRRLAGTKVCDLCGQTVANLFSHTRWNHPEVARAS